MSPTLKVGSVLSIPLPLGASIVSTNPAIVTAQQAAGAWTVTAVKVGMAALVVVLPPDFHCTLMVQVV